MHDEVVGEVRLEDARAHRLDEVEARAEHADLPREGLDQPDLALADERELAQHVQQADTRAADEDDARGGARDLAERERLLQRVNLGKGLLANANLDAAVVKVGMRLEADVDGRLKGVSWEGRMNEWGWT